MVFGQTTENPPKRINSPFSRNPKTKTPKPENKPESESNNNTETVQTSEPVKVEDRKTDARIEISEKNSDLPEEVPRNSKDFESRSVASKTLEVAKRAGKAALSPTEIYKVGVGDVLFISLQNAPAGSTTYFTVLNDGSIDFPIAGGMVPVSGLMTEEIETLLKEKIKLIENPQLSVRVRDHSSHSINVLGLVEKPGLKYLQREAVPLFVVRAEAIVQSRANRVTVRRSNAGIETFDLEQNLYENILIFPGDMVEFSYFETPKEMARAPQFYYIGGEIRSVGQKDFFQGITLTQAILASGGLTKPKIKTVIIRRKNQEGLLVSNEYDLNQIKNGKVPDPLLEPGDTIEIG